MFNMMIEIAWLVPAGAIIFTIQAFGTIWLVKQKRSFRSKTWIVASALGVLYCWTRWGVWAVTERWQIPYPDSLDFKVAMSLAAFAGLFIVAWRSRKA